jgi:hypothetical protein
LKPFGVFKTAFEIKPTTRQEPEDLAKEFVAQSKDLVVRMNKLMGKWLTRRFSLLLIIERKFG